MRANGIHYDEVAINANVKSIARHYMLLIDPKNLKIKTTVFAADQQYRAAAGKRISDRYGTLYAYSSVLHNALHNSCAARPIFPGHAQRLAQ